MTTDHDLLARIDERIKHYDFHPIVSEGGSPELEATFERMFIPTTLKEWRLQLSAWKALRAVVELHKPSGHGGVTSTGRKWIECSCEMEYPCYNIKAIEKELR